MNLREATLSTIATFFAVQFTMCLIAVVIAKGEIEQLKMENAGLKVLLEYVEQKESL